MVLHPLTPEAPSHDCIPAWQAISATQLRRRDAYWLITQPDHAALAGALAARFDAPDFPQLEPDVVCVIGLHDAGWSIFSSETGDTAPPLNREGKPLSFFEIAPPDFLRAWTASIDRAEQIAAIGGLIVSRHFCWLGQYRLQSAGDPPEITAMVRRFLEVEAARQQRLRELDRRPEPELERLTSVLQFCDLLSLYLCSGAHATVEFPQQLASRPVRLSWKDGGCVLAPSPFRNGASLGVTARRYPPDASAPAATSLAFLLW